MHIFFSLADLLGKFASLTGISKNLFFVQGFSIFCVLQCKSLRYPKTGLKRNDVMCLKIRLDSSIKADMTLIILK